MSDQPIGHPGGLTPMQQQINAMAAGAAPAVPASPMNTTPVNPANFTPVAVAVDNDLALQFTQTVRSQIATNMMQDGALTGHDQKQTGLLLTVLKDMDSQSIASKRIKAEEKTSGILGDVSALVNRVLDSVNPNSFGVHQGLPPVDIAAREVQQDGNIQAVPGEMDVNPVQLNYKEFTGKMRGDQPPPQA